MATEVMERSDAKDTALRLGPKGRRVFTVKGWNDEVRKAGVAAASLWISAYMPLRWNRGYATSVLRYFPGGKVPFYEKGRLQTVAINGVRVDVTAKKGLARILIRVPFGHAVDSSVGDGFRTVPPRERTLVAKEFRRALIIGLQTGRAVHAARAQAKAQAQATQAASRAAARAETRRRRSASYRATLPQGSAS